MSKKIHIISFNIPLPANYGGVISVFFHLKALHQLGAKITLHCYEYGREHSEELHKYCENVHYYKRNMSPIALLHKTPFIVQTRQHPDLLARLLADDSPILFEGLHTCAFLAHPDLKNRLKIVRTHNIEADYYRNLARLETHFFKKKYFQLESWKLQHFEKKILVHADHILAISPNDTDWFSSHHRSVHYIPAFHHNEQINIKKGHGEYVLYHGDLSVKDNFNAALFLIENVFADTEIPFIIAGLNPPEILRKAVEKHRNIILKMNVSQREMTKLIHDAHVNLLYSFNASGMKLKLLNALFLGRFCLVNHKMIENTGTETLCHIANTPQAIQTALLQLHERAFGQNDIQQRHQILGHRFCNIENAKITYRLL